jgi:hypothetical protein
MPLRGSCHCGKIAFTLDEEAPAQALSCNCSICRRKGGLLHASVPDKFTLQGSREDIQIYTFNSHKIQHHFCKTCGCAPFASGSDLEGTAMVVVNLRCVDDMDLDALEIVHFDGASL